MPSSYSPISLFPPFLAPPLPDNREVTRERRLQAAITAAEQLEESMDDDGKHALVDSERLARLLGFLRRDREDLEKDRL